MKTAVDRRGWNLVLLVGVLVALTPGCGVNLNFSSDAGSGSSCVIALDCEGLAHTDCDGEWTCSDNACVWNCHPVQGCRKDADCQDWAAKIDVACAGHAACQGGGCAWVCDGVKECVSDADCPAGYECVFEAVPMAGADNSTGAAPKCGGAVTAGVKCIPNGTCELKNPDTPCVSDADCPAGFHCEWPMYNGGTEDGTSGTATKCGGLKCIPTEEGMCVPDGQCVCAEYYDPVCGTDGQTYGNDCFAKCAGVGIAHTGACGAGCWTDADCGPGFACQYNNPCPVYGAGVDAGPSFDAGPADGCMGECVPVQAGCQSDADCPAGERCVRMPCDCMDTDPNCADVCANGAGQCEPVAVNCTSDVDCRPSEQCLFDACPDCGPNMDCGPCIGHCAPRAFCTDDTQCGPGERCVMDPCPDCPECGMCAGHCEAAQITCYTDQDCPTGQICQDPCPAGDCMALSVCVPGPVQCFSDADCAPGQFCDQSLYADMTGCCIPTDPTTGAGCPADYPLCPGVCRPAICPAIDCAPVYCEYGFKIDAAGCNTCECNQPPQKCETFNDPNGHVCTRCYNTDGSVTLTCGPQACLVGQVACASDMDCKGGSAGICVSGCCQFPYNCVETFAACTDNSMCPDGTTCFDGACCYGLK